MSEQSQNERNAIQILALAANSYLNKMDDELAKNFVGPQVNAAIQIIAAIVEERNPAETVVPAEVVVAEPSDK